MADTTGSDELKLQAMMADTTGSTVTRTPAIRRALRTAGVLVIGAGAVLGGDLFGLRETLLGAATPPPRPVAVSAFSSIGPSGKAEVTVLRSQPWWQGVEQLHGVTGATKASFTINRSAAQWRANWSCQRGRLTVGLAGRATPLIDAACPGSGSALATGLGATQLSVRADGSWKLGVDQQVDVPLVEPPPAAIAAPGTSRVSLGSFYRIDQTGTGRFSIYRLASGKYLLRLTGFYVTPNVDLEIRLSPLKEPRSTREYLSTPAVLVAPLNITAGSLNFVVPGTVDPRRYRSLVIWCPLINSAYAAARLTTAS